MQFESNYKNLKFCDTYWNMILMTHIMAFCTMKNDLKEIPTTASDYLDKRFWISTEWKTLNCHLILQKVSLSLFGQVFKNEVKNRCIKDVRFKLQIQIMIILVFSAKFVKKFTFVQWIFFASVLLLCCKMHCNLLKYANIWLRKIY